MSTTTGDVVVPGSVRFPVQLRAPDGFDPQDLATWPVVEGRLEYVEGRLLYEPPCGQEQGALSLRTAGVLAQWLAAHRDFRGATLEIGITLGGETRGADAAVWRREQGAPLARTTLRFAPILTVEIAGVDEGEPELREKARWYLAHAVEVVWLVFPDSRGIVVLHEGAETRAPHGGRLPEHSALPGLAPAVRELFVQVDDA